MGESPGDGLAGMLTQVYLSVLQTGNARIARVEDAVANQILMHFEDADRTLREAGLSLQERSVAHQVPATVVRGLEDLAYGRAKPQHNEQTDAPKAVEIPESPPTPAPTASAPSTASPSTRTYRTAAQIIAQNADRHNWYAHETIELCVVLANGEDITIPELAQRLKESTNRELSGARQLIYKHKDEIAALAKERGGAFTGADARVASGARRALHSSTAKPAAPRTIPRRERYEREPSSVEIEAQLYHSALAQIVRRSSTPLTKFDLVEPLNALIEQRTGNVPSETHALRLLNTLEGKLQLSKRSAGSREYTAPDVPAPAAPAASPQPLMPAPETPVGPYNTLTAEQIRVRFIAGGGKESPSIQRIITQYVRNDGRGTISDYAVKGEIGALVVIDFLEKANLQLGPGTSAVQAMQPTRIDRTVFQAESAGVQRPNVFPELFATASEAYAAGVTETDLLHFIHAFDRTVEEAEIKAVYTFLSATKAPVTETIRSWPIETSTGTSAISIGTLFDIATHDYDSQRLIHHSRRLHIPIQQLHKETEQGYEARRKDIHGLIARLRETYSTTRSAARKR